MPDMNKEEAVEQFNKKLSDGDKNYQRAQMQTYMTAPEWRNVDMADEFASFSKSNKPFYLFPYFSQTVVFWKILANSVKAARNQGSSWGEILLSDFFMMDVFIGAFTTVEYLSKGLLSLPAKALAYLTGHTKNNSDTQEKLTEVFKDYSDFIHHTPFYDYNYVRWVPQLWSTFYHSTNKTLDDVFSLLYYSIELPLKGLIATPVSWLYNTESNQAYETIDVLFSYEAPATEPPIEEDVEKPVNQKFETVFEAIKEEHQITKNPTFFTRESGTLIKATLPRYEPLISAIQTLHNEGFKVERVAGQSKIQLKSQLNAYQTHGKTGDPMFRSLTESLNKASVLYHYSNSIDPNLRFAMLEVATEHLNEVMDALQMSEDTSLLLIHDF